eukprot:TRINITY_DN22136_c0_g1_i1.p1 TRINITY_DN22136_c0_g1~~TRINITY_DN22136_c0_g1_i1.p1  ORF type:complete len:396 (-),score=50.80 TRINITY_DN22136_c0_g1_i1:23-1210(-)
MSQAIYYSQHGVQFEKSRQKIDLTPKPPRICVLHDHVNKIVPYEQAWNFQKNLVNKKITSLQQKNAEIDDQLIILQHEKVYTLGAGSTVDNLKFEFNESPIPIFRTERGGEVTYHGPGQIVMYPILNLKNYECDLHWYLRSLEEVVIRALDSTWGLKSKRISGMSGVWINQQDNNNNYSYSFQNNDVNSDFEININVTGQDSYQNKQKHNCTVPKESQNQQFRNQQQIYQIRNQMIGHEFSQDPNFSNQCDEHQTLLELNNDSQIQNNKIRASISNQFNDGIEKDFNHRNIDNVNFGDLILDQNGFEDKKIGAVGIRAKKWVTYHGIAVNVCMDMEPFDEIVPCGIHDFGVTSVEQMVGLGENMVMETYHGLLDAFQEVFGVEFVNSTENNHFFQ